jgi:hypothetical protein
MRVTFEELLAAMEDEYAHEVNVVLIVNKKVSVKPIQKYPYKSGF